MRWSGGTKRGPIGLDVGNRAIKAVQLSRGGRGGITAAMTIPRQAESGPLEVDELLRLAQVLERQGFEGSNVVLAAPGESLLVGTLSLPPRHSGAPVDQIARAELARLHRHDPMSFELVHWELPPATSGASGAAASKSGTTSVMAAACPHKDSETLLDLFEAADLQVVGIDVPWLALARACSPMLSANVAKEQHTGDESQQPAPISAILDIGWRTARVIVLRSEVILFERVLTDGGLCKLRDGLRSQLQLDDQAADFLMREVGCSPPHDAQVVREAGERREAADEDDVYKEPRRLVTAHFATLAQEMQVSLSYAVQQFRGQGIDTLLLAGGGGAVAGLAAHLASAMNIQVLPAHAAQLAPCPAGLDRICSSTVLTTALGLAMYEV